MRELALKNFDFFRRSSSVVFVGIMGVFLGAIIEKFSKPSKGPSRPRGFFPVRE